MENWKDIPNYIGKYQISDLGNIKNLSFRKYKMKIIIMYLILIISTKQSVTDHSKLILIKNDVQLKEQLEYAWKDIPNKPKIIVVKVK